MGMDFIAIRAPTMLPYYQTIMQMAHAIIEEAFSSAIITAGTTTCDDVRWWMREEILKIGLVSDAACTLQPLPCSVARVDAACCPALIVPAVANTPIHNSVLRACNTLRHPITMHTITLDIATTTTMRRWTCCICRLLGFTLLCRYTGGG